MKPKEFAFIVYAVSDLKKGRDFYENVLGFKPESVWVDEEKGTGMIEYGFGPDNSYTLAIGSGVEQFKPGKNGGVAAIEVEDFDEAVKALKSANVTFVAEPMETSMCHMAVFTDPDGNQMMVHKRKPKENK